MVIFNSKFTKKAIMEFVDFLLTARV